jgi:hypothetical protein
MAAAFKKIAKRLIIIGLGEEAAVFLKSPRYTLQ